MTEHALKTLPAYWYAIERGEKNFDVLKNDRGFQKGGSLVLELHDGQRFITDSYTGSRSILRRKVTYVLPCGQFGISPGYVVMGLKK